MMRLWMPSAPAPSVAGSGMHSPSVKMPGRSGCGSVRGETTISPTPSRNSRGTSPAIRATIASKSERRIASGPHDSVPAETLRYEPRHLVEPDTLLLHRIAVPRRHGALGRRLAVHGDPERRARLVHPAVPPPDRAAVVVEHGESALDVVVQRRGELRHSLFLDQREHAGLDRRHRRVEAEDHARLALDLLLAVGVDQERKRDAVHAG